MDDEQCRFDHFFHSFMCLAVELEHFLVTKNESPHRDKVSITEAYVDVFALDVLHRYRGQLKHVKFREIKRLLVKCLLSFE